MSQLTRETFGPHLRALRTAAGLSQRIAAKHAGVDVTTWRRWEDGGMPMAVRAPTIANAIGTNMVDLLDPDPERVFVADLTITQDALARVRKGGAPELDRVAAQVAEHAHAKVAELAARVPPEPRPDPPSRHRPVASQTRARLAAHHAARAASS